MTRKHPPIPIVVYGKALHGERWKAPLARALGIGLRSIKRYAKGEIQTPPGVLLDCMELLRRRGVEISRMARE